MSPKTEAALFEIRAAVANGCQGIAPCTFGRSIPRANISAAFKIAKQQGLIEVAYVSIAGTPCYRPAGTGAAIAEAITAVRH